MTVLRLLNLPQWGINNVPAALDSSFRVIQTTRPWHPIQAARLATLQQNLRQGADLPLTPAELQRRFRAREWPFDGTVKRRNLKKVI